jgi:hypothetical protein
MVMQTQATQHSETDYVVSLITDCHKQKYMILLPKNATVALAELRQALKTAQDNIPTFQQYSNSIILDLQALIAKHLTQEARRQKPLVVHQQQQHLEVRDSLQQPFPQTASQSSSFRDFDHLEQHHASDKINLKLK